MGKKDLRFPFSVLPKWAAILLVVLMLPLWLIVGTVAGFFDGIQTWLDELDEALNI